MIKLLNSSNLNELQTLLSKLDNIMGRDLDQVNPLTLLSRRDSILEHLVSSRFSWDSPSKRNIGWYHEDELKAVLFQDFSKTVKAWSISYYFSSCGNMLGRTAGGECLDFAITEAERLNYYEYYRVIESSKYKAFNKYAISELRHRYELVLDELVPAHEKPMTSLSWDWLFEGNSKDVDTVIVKGILKQEFRPNKI
jgi:hypothetical protein